jgi:hypothetical protein
VEQQADQMAYHVALDVDQTANKALMQRVGAKGIPTAFLVDWQGALKWYVVLLLMMMMMLLLLLCFNVV